MIPLDAHPRILADPRFVRRDQPRRDLALWVLGALMQRMNRSDALDEATFSAMETVVTLIRAADEQGPGHDQRLESLRLALASARATVIAAGYALVATSDVARMSYADGADSSVSDPDTPAPAQDAS